LILILLTLPTYVTSQTFSEFLKQVLTQTDSVERARVIERYLPSHPPPLVEDSMVRFYYRGAGTRVAVPGDLNGWNPSAAPMRRIEGTDLFLREDTIPIDGRVEYKLWVDSVWMLDPRNPRRAEGGFGENSELLMPGYPSPPIMWTSGRGPLDTLWLESHYLHRTYPVYVHRSPGTVAGANLPVIYVTDGGEYLSLAGLDRILDRLTLAKRIRPVVAVFIDPRTDPRDPSSNKRMLDYAASDAFLDFLEKEISPVISGKYPVSKDPENRLILGASMGGLISTYAVLRRGNFITNSASQSPAYLQADSAVIRLLNVTERVRGDFYIQTGTIHDTRAEALLVSQLLKAKGARVTFEEYHEGHNWTNWRNKLDKILVHFFPYP
jgi:enterochelin esterase family protein